MSGEAASRSDITVPGPQLDLAHELKGYGQAPHRGVDERKAISHTMAG
ncbi:MAG: hypothetical protein H6561_11480 [Lewinellaceae bacterium]|nr:hypothetical protein [Lewinellaceae bacterium]